MAKKEVKKTWLDYLKQYWFVAVVCLGLLVYVGIYCVQAYQNRPIYVSAKKVDGQYVVFSIDDKNYMAEDLYADLYAANSNTMIQTNFYRDALNNLYKTTDTMSNMGASYANYQLSNYTEEQVFSDLAARGLQPADVDALKEYYVTYLKGIEVIKDYFKENKTELQELIGSNPIKSISHILVKVNSVITNEDGSLSANPTSEESEKLAKVQEALKTMSFEEVAKQYSDDGSASNGGMLGVDFVSNLSSKYVATFAAAASKLEDDVISEPVVSEYGWHFIKVNTPTVDEIVESTEIVASIYENNTSLLQTALTKVGLNKINYVINDDKFKSYLLGSEE